MVCGSARELQRFVDGDLDARRTVGFLDHLKTCEDCRKSLAVTQDVAPTLSRTPSDLPYRQYDAQDIARARRVHPGSRRRGFTAMILIVVLTWYAGRSQRPDQKGGVGETIRTAAAASSGNHPLVVIAPSGPGPRPRQVRGTVPPGCEGITLRVSRDGQTVFERTLRPTDPGFEVLPSQDPNTPPAAVFPFPGTDVLPLEMGVSYEVRIVVPSMGASPPAVFEIAGPP